MNYHAIGSEALISRHIEIKTSPKAIPYKNKQKMFAPEPDSWLEEADRLKMQGRHEDAIELCEKILLTDVHCIEAFEEIGDNFLSLKEYEKAKKALLRAVQLDAQSANAHYLLGFAFSCTGEWERSIKELEFSDRLLPNHPEILRCLGWSYFHNSQKKKGVIVLERALNLAWDDCLIMCDLGVCYLNEKNFERAAILFKKVLNLEPDNEKARECLKACEFFKREYDKLQKKGAY